MIERYGYRLKARLEGTTALIVGHYATKAPATAALYDHINMVQDRADRRAWWDTPKADRKKIVKDIAARDYELVTFVMVEKSTYESLVDDSDKLGALEDAGVDNWEWYDEAMKTYRDGKAEDAE